MLHMCGCVTDCQINLPIEIYANVVLYAQYYETKQPYAAVVHEDIDSRAAQLLLLLLLPHSLYVYNIIVVDFWI